MIRGVREPVAPFYGPVVREQRISLSLIEIPKTRNLLAPREVGITDSSAFKGTARFFTSQFSLEPFPIKYLDVVVYDGLGDIVKKNTIFALRPVDSPERRSIHCRLKKIDEKKTESPASRSLDNAARLAILPLS